MIALDHYLLAVAAHDAQNRAEAIQQCEAALRLEPTHYWSLMRLGICLCDLGQGAEDFAGAARVFTGCIVKRPGHANAYCCRGNAYSKLSRTQEAETDFREAMRLRPDFPEAHGGLARTLFLQGKYAEAEAENREALRLLPDYPEAHCGLALTLYK